MASTAIALFVLVPLIAALVITSFVQDALESARMRRVIKGDARPRASEQLDWKIGGYIDPEREPAEPDDHVVRSVRGIFVRIR